MLLHAILIALPPSDKMLSIFGQPGRYRNTTHVNSHKHNRASLPLIVSLKGNPGHHRQVADDTIHDTYTWESDHHFLRPLKNKLLTFP